MIHWIFLLPAAVIGGALGFLSCALCVVSGRRDDEFDYEDEGEAVCSKQADAK